MSHAVEHIDVRMNQKAKKQKVEDKAPAAVLQPAVVARPAADGWSEWLIFMVQDTVTFLWNEGQNNPTRFTLCLLFFLGFWILRRLGNIESMLLEQQNYFRQLDQLSKQ